MSVTNATKKLRLFRGIVVSAYSMSKLLAWVARVVVSKLVVFTGLVHIDRRTSHPFSTYLLTYLTLLRARYFISSIQPDYNRPTPLLHIDPCDAVDRLHMPDRMVTQLMLVLEPATPVIVLAIQSINQE